MFIEGFPVWQQIIYWALILSVFLSGIIVILGFLIIHVIDPFMGFIANMKKIWKEEMDKGRK